ncbi:MAG TPA: CoA-binding protein [Candidatus Polarisedimenticolia bacterium]|nr:CoA-binding protein [Candidatus Polarisedimenticolia bacterium]
MTERCEMPARQATAQEIHDILTGARRIAVVGHSDDPSRDSYRIGRYLAAHGYEVFAVNPNARTTPEIRFYPDLASVPRPIDVVDIFRKPEFIAAIVDEAIAIGAGAIWMQLGLAHNAAAEKARAAGLKVVMNRCIMIEHRAL